MRDLLEKVEGIKQLTVDALRQAEQEPDPNGILEELDMLLKHARVVVALVEARDRVGGWTAL